MPIYTNRPRGSETLLKRLREIKDQTGKDSRPMRRLKSEVAAIVVQDNEDKLYRHATQYGGVDYRGRPLAAPADSTVKGWTRKGLILQLLAPHGLASRAITNFRAVWRWTGEHWQLVSGWLNTPWIIYHLFGAPKGSKASQPNWSLPRRDVAGVTPKGMAQIRQAFRRFTDSLRKKG